MKNVTQRRDLHLDAATQHRVAGIFALAFGAAGITALAGVFSFDIAAFRVAPLFGIEVIPDAGWTTAWLPGSAPAAYQQNEAVRQWTNLVLIFGAITAAIACINALIGFVSHANERRYETALRSLLGASPRHLADELRRSAIINGIAGGCTGAATGAIAALMLRRMWRSDAALEGAWALLALALCLATAAYASRLAGKRLRRKGWMGDALAPEARTVPGFGAEDLRAVLTSAQLACAVALTVVSLMVWSYASTAERAGAERAADRYVARAHGNHHEVLKAVGNAATHGESIASPGALLGIGRVDLVVSDCGPCVRANMYAPMFTVETQHHVAGAGFFGVAGIPLVAGNEFDKELAQPRRIVVNETFSREAFQGQDAVGKRVLVGGFQDGEWYTVIGVAKDIRIEGLHFLESSEPGGRALPSYAPAIYFFADEHAPDVFDVIVRAAAAPAVAGLSFASLPDMIARAREPQQSFSRVLSLLGILLCGAAVMGAFTATMLSVRSRRLEIATRRAVGARRRDISALVYSRVVGVTLRGIATGVVASVALSRALEVFVPGLPMMNVRIVLAVSAAFFIIALLATLAPLRTALRIAPAQTNQ